MFWGPLPILSGRDLSTLTSLSSDLICSMSTLNWVMWPLTNHTSSFGSCDPQPIMCLNAVMWPSTTHIPQLGHVTFNQSHSSIGSCDLQPITFLNWVMWPSTKCASCPHDLIKSTPGLTYHSRGLHHKHNVLCMRMFACPISFVLRKWQLFAHSWALL